MLSKPKTTQRNEKKPQYKTPSQTHKTPLSRDANRTILSHDRRRKTLLRIFKI
jgi:hypothetical protein